MSARLEITVCELPIALAPTRGTTVSSNGLGIYPANGGTRHLAMGTRDHAALPCLYIDRREAFKVEGECTPKLGLCEQKLFRVWGPINVVVNARRPEVPSLMRVGCVN
jgi:hypothetical protein